MNYKMTNKTPSPKKVGKMLGRKGVINDGGSIGLDFYKIEDNEIVERLAGYLARKVPRYYSVVAGFISDNSRLSMSVAECLQVKHYFISQDNNVKATLARFNGTKEVNVLLVKALLNDVEMNEWYNLLHIYENVHRIAVATVADGRFLPCENQLEVFSLTDYNYIHA
jgi:hypothetical protein